jgi:formate dehydrogenase maturation protein FdhE
VREHLSHADYAATRGRICPACAGTDIANGDDITVGRSRITRRLCCENCGATWDAVYTLSGYEGLTTPEETPHA